MKILTRHEIYHKNNKTLDMILNINKRTRMNKNVYKELQLNFIEMKELYNFLSRSWDN